MKKQEKFYFYHFVISPSDELSSFTRTQTDQKHDTIKTTDTTGKRLIGVFVSESEDREFMANIYKYISTL